ncbi:S-layer homology domain-containing protein [Paenibacillus sp. V4I7]|uniref:S-layer homology domain-containing protein n=1 Tax=Paenibacillus sp. V4I7 TaxID=3042307 RepID=UPI00278A059A|nr:S-layer homology domain-containing protein [Paenibacillus sp. V4I7]MDQ0897423.1 hypothetical protein [Paenibacillus sp. V4I7]
MYTRMRVKYSVILKLVSSVLLWFGSALFININANAQGELPAVQTVRIDMDMVQAGQRQQHKVPFSADKGILILKQELVTDDNVAHVSVIDPISGEIVGEAKLEGYAQVQVTLPHNGNYEFYFSNFGDNFIDSEPRFEVSLTGANLKVEDTAVPKFRLGYFEPYTIWSEPASFEIGSDTYTITAQLDGESVDLSEVGDHGNMPLTINPKGLTEGFHTLNFITEKKSGTGTMITRRFIVDNEDAFSDVPKAHWAHKPVEIMNLLGILDGRNPGVFEPSKSVTRAEFAKMLATSIKLPVDSNSIASRFSDVPTYSWSNPYVEALAKEGVTEGEQCGQGLCFNPNRQISRAEAAAMMTRTGKVSQVDHAQEKGFMDVNYLLPSWAYNGIVKLSKAGWIDGYEDALFHPFGTLTRAEAAKLVGKFRKI